MQNSQSDRVLRVAYPSALNVTAYEPTRINIDYEYHFLRNIYSPLVEISKDGSIEPGIAEKIEWSGKKLKLTIRSNLKTIKGTPITAADAVFSLKRLLVLSGNTHGNFNDIICPGLSLKSIEDACPGIQQDGNVVLLNATQGKSFLLPMLASIDFAIIPQKSVDPKTLKIMDFSETSGPYYVDKDNGGGNIELKLNPNHYFSSKDIAQKIILVPMDPNIKGESLKALKNGEVDHLSIIDSARADEMIPFVKENPEFDIHITMKIRTLSLTFTDRGRKELSIGERRFIGEKIRNIFSTFFKDMAGYEQRPEFFPSLGEGGLTEDQRAILSKIRLENLITPNKKFKIGIFKRGSLKPWSDPINAALPTAICYTENSVPDLKEYSSDDDIPHAFIAATDTGFMEDISLISYSMNAGYLGLNKSERSKWLADYMNTEEKAERIKKLKDLHFKTLSEASTFPLITLPFSALSRKPWKMELSDLFASNQLWLIKHR